MSNSTPILPLPDEPDEGDATMAEDGKRTLDPDAADELIDSADADRIASESGDEVDED
ncbi:hypothetical protein L2X99_08455 [Microbacterium sp. KUDC0406]|uniref:hypothetical protein n=1 Tax=Microbacterium sp. KUDC0406 TaxID=2909588 RepID=UPI001F403C5B|nr:hypothetical protein [Microbacterium sp. KUDC0406]UJP11510.1 hypothetical protein L2X99_08455 [Microbacterium sp. KUDC0406]